MGNQLLALGLCKISPLSRSFRFLSHPLDAPSNPPRMVQDSPDQGLPRVYEPY